MKKIISLLLALMMLFAVVACSKDDGNGKDGSDTTVGDTSADTEDPTVADPNLPKQDFGGDKVIIVSVDHTGDYNEFSVFEDSVDALDSKVYMRNEAINEKYNVKIDVIHQANGDIVNYVGTQIQTGVAEFDIINTGYTYQCTLVNLGLLVDMNEVPHINTEKEYWSQQMLKDANILGKNYFLVSSANLWSMHQASVCFINTQLVEDLGFEKTPYDLVEDDEWTFEAFETMSKAAYNDIDQVPGSSEGDQFGVVSTPVGPEAMFTAFGGKYIKLDDKNTPTSNAFTNETYSLLTDIIEYWSKDEAAGPEAAIDSVGTFGNGSSLFFVEGIGAIALFNDTEFIVGIAPVPKYDDNQETYLTPTHADWSTALSVPDIPGSNLEKLGAILEDMAYLSHRDVRPEYYEKNLKARRVQDETSIKMLDVIFDHLTFDLGFALNNVTYGARGLARGLVAAKNTNVVSAFEGYKTQYDTALQTYLDKILANNEE